MQSFLLSITNEAVLPNFRSLGLTVTIECFCEQPIPRLDNAHEAVINYIRNSLAVQTHATSLVPYR